MTNQANSAVVTNEVSRGRKPFLDNVNNVIKALVAIQNGDTENMPTRRIMMQLVDADYLTMTEAEREEGQRGRCGKIFTITDETKAWLEKAVVEQRVSARDEQRKEIEALLQQEVEAKAGLESLKAAIKAKKAELKAAETADAKAEKAAAKEAEKAVVISDEEYNHSLDDPNEKLGNDR